MKDERQLRRAAEVSPPVGLYGDLTAPLCEPASPHIRAPRKRGGKMGAR